MTRYKGYAPLQKLVQQVDSAEAEIRRLEALKTTLSEEREKLIGGGAFEDERKVTAASTLGTKLSMIPFKLRQLQDMVRSVRDDLGTLIRALRIELGEEQAHLLGAARGTLASFITPELRRVLGHDPQMAERYALEIASRSLCCQLIAEITPSQAEWETNPLERAKGLLRNAVAVERIRAAFFKGEELDLGAVEKKTGFKLAA